MKRQKRSGSQLDLPMAIEIIKLATAIVSLLAVIFKLLTLN